MTNFDYPLYRRLYLLWWPGQSVVEEFIQWTSSEEGQRVVMKRFVGTRVVGKGSPASGHIETGALIVYTETFPVYDGGVYYCPHRPYEILTSHGEFVRRVANHRGENDERPTKVSLPPGTYLIRPEASGYDRREFFVEIKAGQTTPVRVEEKSQSSP